MQKGISVAGQPVRIVFGKRFVKIYLLIAIPFLLLVAAQMYASYRSEKTAASTDAQNLALVIESRLAKDFSTAAKVVSYIAGQIPREALQPELASRYSASVTPLLKSQVHSVASSSAMRVFAANGDRLYSSMDDEPAMNIADRLFFRQLASNPSSDVIFSEVLLGRITKRVSMYIAKALRSGNGRFLGVVLTAIDLNALREDFSRLNLGPNGIVAVRRLDNGAPVVRYPGPVDVVNTPAPELPVLKALRTYGSGGSLESVSPIDAVRRMHGFHTIGDTPLFVAVGLAEGDYLSNWKLRSLCVVMSAIAFLVMLGFVFRRLAISETRRVASEHAVGESDARFRTLVTHNHAVILQIEPESGRIVDANTAATEFYGWSHDKLCSMNIADINQLGVERVGIERQAAAREERSYFIFPHRLANGEIRTVEVHSTPIELDGQTLLVSIIHDIAERKRIEEELIASEQRYDYAMAAIGEGLWDWDILHNEVHHNATWCEILGLDKNAMKHPLGFFLSVIHKDDAKNVQNAIQLAIDRDVPYVSEHRMVRSDGSDVWVADRGKVVERDASGKAIRMVGCMMDVTQNHISEQKFTDERTKLQALLDTASDGIHVLDPDGNLIVCSRSFGEMLGYGSDEVMALNVRQWDASIKEEDIGAVILDMMQSPTVFESRHRRRDGSLIDVEIAARGIVISGKQCLYASSRDVTLRKRQEMEIERQRMRLQNIIEGTQAGTFEWNIETGVVDINPRWAEMIGYTYDELTPMSQDRWLALTHPDDIPLIKKQMMECLSVEHGYYEGESRKLHRDGHWVWVLTRGKILAWTAEKKPLMMSGTCLDVSEQKNNELRLIEARQAAESANQAKSQFLAIMSHEIRTPLNGILGMAQLLLLSETSPEERMTCTRTIYESGRTLLTLLNDILDLSKVEAGKVELETVAFSPAQMLQEISVLFSETAKGKGLSVSWQSNGIGMDRQYLGDPMRLRQMLGNLVDNAIKFTEEGAITLSVEIAANYALDACRPTTLRFAVSDCGIGISDEEKLRLFQPFTQVDSTITRRFGGTGLGLAIIRRLVELMGGQLGVDSLPGKGSTFWFVVPLVPVNDNQERVDARPDSVKGGASSNVLHGDGRRILVVDDAPTNRLIVERFLTKNGFVVTEAENGQQAIDWLANNPAPDLILMDCQMPVMDGVEATRRIRQREAEQVDLAGEGRIPVIAFTADVFSEEKVEFRAAGMDDFLGKPVDFVEFNRVLGHWLPETCIVPPLVSRDPPRFEREPEACATDNMVPVSATVLDLEEALGRVDGDLVALKRIAAILPARMAENERLIAVAMSMEDWGALRKLVHQLKGDMGLIGAKQAFECCVLLESAVRSNEVAVYEEKWRALQVAIEALRPKLAEFLQSS